MTYPKIYKPAGLDGGDELVVAAGGKITVEADGTIDFESGAVLAGATVINLGTAITDPGDAGAIPVDKGSGECALTIEASETETGTLAAPVSVGQILTIIASVVGGSGSRAITVASPINQTGNNKITFDAAGEMVTLIGVTIGAVKAWRVLATDGATLATV